MRDSGNPKPGRVFVRGGLVTKNRTFFKVQYFRSTIIVRLCMKTDDGSIVTVGTKYKKMHKLYFKYPLLRSIQIARIQRSLNKEFRKNFSLKKI